MSSAGAWTRLCQDIRRSVPAQTVDRSFILSLSLPVLPPPSHYWVNTPTHHMSRHSSLSPEPHPFSPLPSLLPASQQHGEALQVWSHWDSFAIKYVHKVKLMLGWRSGLTLSCPVHRMQDLSIGTNPVKDICNQRTCC